MQAKENASASGVRALALKRRTEDLFDSIPRHDKVAPLPEPYHGRRSYAAIIAISVALCGACGDKPKKEAPADDGAATEPATEPVVKRRCVAMPFADKIALAEASGAVVVPNVGLLVAADSGHKGAYQLLDAMSGDILENGRFPLAKNASDDIEGLTRNAFLDGDVVALSSSGMVERVHARG